jgi:hypothetical protein
MKTIKIMKNLNTLVILALISLFIPALTLAQDSEKKELKLKVIKEENGSRTVIDTTISLTDLVNSDQIEKLKSLLDDEQFKSLGIDLNDLDKLDNIYMFHGDDNEGGTIVMSQEVEVDGNGEQTIELYINSDGEDLNGKGLKWVSSGDGNTYFYSINGDSTIIEKDGEQTIVIKSTGEGEGSKTFTFSNEMIWTDTGSTQVDVESTDDGKLIKVTREDGTVQEYKVEEEGTYIIDKNGEIKKVEGDEHQFLSDDEKGIIWIHLNDEGPNSNIVVKSIGDDKSEININGKAKQFIISTEEDIDGEDVNVFVKKFESKDGEEMVVVKSHIIVKKLDNKDLDNLEKAGIPFDDKADDLEIDELSFSPNPSNGKFLLEFKTPETGRTQIEIYDVNGKKVYSESIANFEGWYSQEIDISDEQNGVYFLKIQQDTKVSTRKIILE